MIKTLTALRAGFAFLVFCHHLIFIPDKPEVFDWIYAHFFWEGFTGVSFFFILSGFVLTYNYERAFIKSELRARKFYVARFGRIYPLYFLTLLISILLGIMEHNPGEQQLWGLKLTTHILMLQSFVPDPSFYFAFNLPAWSLSCEMFFYLLFPVSIYTLNRLIRKNGRMALLAFAPFFLMPLISLFLADTYRHALIYINPVIRFSDFLLGIFLYQIFKKLRKLSFHVAPTWFEIGALLLILLFYLFHGKVPLYLRFSVYYWIPMSVMLLVLALERGFFSRLLTWQPLLFLGEISFGFYLFHHLVIRGLLLLRNGVDILIDPWAFSIIALLISLVLAAMSYRYFEKPLNVLIRRGASNRFSWTRTTG